MKNVVVVYGGRSVEHDVSVLTGLHAALAAEKRCKVTRVYITRENKMVLGDRNVDKYITIEGGDLSESGRKGTHLRSEKIAEWGKPVIFANGRLYVRGVMGLRSIGKVDAVINCCHGGIGEGGELAAYFAVAGVPFTSCDIDSAKKLMSKTTTREILTSADFDQPKYISISKFDRETVEGLTNRVNAEIGYPVIIKPDKLGSSIGISVANDEGELLNAVAVASGLCDAVIIEEFINFDAEINCAAFKYRGSIVPSRCESVQGAPAGEKNESSCEDQNANRTAKYFDFNEKYMTSSSGFIKKRGNEDVDPIPAELSARIRELTKKAYALFGCCGVVRADFLVVTGASKEEKIYLNEINTVPGFLSYHMFLHAGIKFESMLDMKIDEAIRAHDKSRKQKIVTEFKSDVIRHNRELVL